MANWGQKVYPSDYAEIKALLKAEVGRRGKTEGTARGQSVGSMASYNGSAYDFSTQPTDGAYIKNEHIPNMPGSAAYTSNWAAEIFGPGNLKKSTSGYPQRLYNAALQGALGINQDGIFGANTEKAVKAFQAAHNLTADGIVGTRTKAALSKLL